MRARPDDQRIVVTGIGAISPMGLDVAALWDGVYHGRSAVGPITQFDPSPFPVHIAAEVRGFDPTLFLPPKEARRIGRASQFTIAAVKQALADAGLPTPLPDPERVGVLIGTSVGSLELGVESIEEYLQAGFRKVKPYALAGMLPNMPSYYASLTAGAQGYLGTISTACATGTQAIGEAAEIIRRGAADIMIAGAVESMIHYVCIGGFAAMRALSRRNDDPEHASRPFDRDRDGFVVGEGCGILILERLTSARARGAPIYAEIIGYGVSADAYHLTEPDPEGRGAQRAMRWALADARITPEDVDYINAHATATHLGDIIETRAIKAVFGPNAYRIPISATKSMIGHCLGAAGALELIVTILAMRHQIVPPTINLDNPDPECDLDYVPHTARPHPIRIAISNSFGLGGVNAVLAVQRWEA